MDPMGLVNQQFANWKITIFIGKSTLFLDHFLESNVSLPEFNHQQMGVSINWGYPIAGWFIMENRKIK